MFAQLIESWLVEFVLGRVHSIVCSTNTFMAGENVFAGGNLVVCSTKTIMAG